MMAHSDYERFRQGTYDSFRRAGLFITDEEKARIEVADFGLGKFEETGLGIHVYVNTQRCCAKELAMLPFQTCPEHCHPTDGTNPGKEETFRCRWGLVYLYVEGAPTRTPHCVPPKGRESSFTVWQEVELAAGAQYTILPGTKHWFQAGPEGAVISEFSTRSTDENDLFTDPNVQRSTKIR